ncbi:MAG TPA: hypothetical protein PKE47_01720 [Verrucomicrobiota bacterium]|nr:hypothetical protein [Verrucomicrobiota bacterium]
MFEPGSEGFQTRIGFFALQSLFPAMGLELQPQLLELERDAAQLGVRFFNCRLVPLRGFWEEQHLPDEANQRPEHLLVPGQAIKRSARLGPQALAPPP